MIVRVPVGLLVFDLAGWLAVGASSGERERERGGAVEVCVKDLVRRH